MLNRPPRYAKVDEPVLSGAVGTIGDLDVLVLDLPPGTGGITLSLLELIPQAVLRAVTTPQPTPQTAASRVGRTTRNMRRSFAGVVVSMSTLACRGCGQRTALFGSGNGQRDVAEIGGELLRQVPLDAASQKPGDAGVPMVATRPVAWSAVALFGRLPVVRPGLVGVPLPRSVVV